jgi:simple sugar transport system permease protein
LVTTNLKPARSTVADAQTRERLGGPPAPSGQSRVARAALGLVLRPELTAIVGTIIVFVYFGLTAGDAGFLTWAGTQNYLEVAAEVGIIAVAVTLLLVAGEFDLSVGSMVGCGAIVSAYSITELSLPLWIAILLTAAVATVVGSANWLLVVRFGLPSFIVTLASLFVVRGVTVAGTRESTGGTQIANLHEAVSGDPLRVLFDGSIFGLSVSIYWWIVLTLVAAWILDRAKFGNWIYATGGDLESARRTGVRVDRVKWALFVGTALLAALVGILAAFQVDAAEVTMGNLFEFQTATAAVIGGTMLSGGSGSPIGTFFGALLFGMLNQGFFFTNIADEWFQAFLGLMLVGSVLINSSVRRYALRRQAQQ